MCKYEALIKNNEALPSEEIIAVDIAKASSWEDAYWIGKAIFDSDSSALDKLIMDAYEKAFMLGLNIRTNRECFLNATRQIAVIYFQFGKYEEVINKLMIIDAHGEDLPDWISLYFASAQIHTEMLLYYAESPQRLFDRIDRIDLNNQESVNRREYIFRDFLNRISDVSESNNSISVAVEAILNKAEELGLSESIECYQFKYAMGLIEEVPDLFGDNDTTLNLDLQRFEEKETKETINYDQIIEDYSKQIDEIQTEANNLKSELLKRDREIGEYERKIENDSKELIRLQATVEQLADENKAAKATEYELKAEIEALKSRLAGREAENRQLEESAAALGSLKADNEALKVRIKNEISNNEKLSKERDENKAKYESAWSDSIKFQEELLNLRAVVDRLSSKLNEEKEHSKLADEARAEAEQKYNDLLNTAKPEEPKVKPTATIQGDVPSVKDFLKRNKKILIMGESRAKEDQLRGKLKALGFDFEKKQLEFELDYNNLDKCAQSIQPYTSRYAGVIVGPCPHMLKNTDGSSSFIQKMIDKEGYPHVVKATNKKGELELTKESLGSAMMEMSIYLSTCA